MSILSRTWLTGRGRGWLHCRHLAAFRTAERLWPWWAGVGGLVLSSATGPDVRATTHARRRDSTVPAPGGTRAGRGPGPPTIDDCGSTTGGGRTGTAGRTNRGSRHHAPAA